MRLLTAALTILLATTASAQTPDPLKNLPAHPRLVLLDSDIPAIKSTIAADPFAASIYAELQAEGDKMLSQKPYPYKIDGPEKNLLFTARNVEHIIFTTSGLYRLTGNRKYADRAIAEMLNAAAYPDWNPIHFLDTAELTAALGIGYDWLYPILSTDQRTTIHAALIHLGIDPWLNEIAGTGVSINGKPPKPFDRTNNWTQVCTGGETLGTLALADIDPARARKVLDDSVPRMKKIMALFAPDGGFEEGPTYWSYATNYNVLYLAALKSTIGTDFGLSQLPGFAETGAYRIQAQGPFFDGANFGDSHEGIFRAPQMFWMATQFHKPEYTIAERRLDEAYAATPDRRMPGESQRFLIFTFAFYKPTPTTAELPTVQHFERTGQAFIRSNWSTPTGAADPNAFYIALKGGSAKASHGHLDLGAFIFDALGERWALDLGAETYGVPQYFGKLRFTYFRTSTPGHNTLTIDNTNEDLDANTPITSLGQNPTATSKYAILNLDSAYKSQLKSWHRGIHLIDNTHLIVQDELQPAITPTHPTADIHWNLFTRATCKPGPTPQQATLQLHGKTMHLRILSPATATFTTTPLPTLPAPQVSVTGISNLTIHLPNTTQPTTLSILFTPDDTTPPPPTTPLSTWPTK